MESSRQFSYLRASRIGLGDPVATNTFSGYVNLTDKDGFVAGLPFECTEFCSNVIYTPDNGVTEFNWLNSSLDANPTTPTPEPSSPVLLGVGIVGILALKILADRQG